MRTKVLKQITITSERQAAPKLLITSPFLNSGLLLAPQKMVNGCQTTESGTDTSDPLCLRKLQMV
jgi:hypothetical protein